MGFFSHLLMFIYMDLRLQFLAAFIFPLMLFGIGDSTRQEIRLDMVYQTFGYEGDSVVVAIIDRGIDYTHPDFIDANGMTRISWIYDMVDPTGANAPGNPFGIGTIYSESEINAALSGGNALPTNDLFGHGIATTGIAAGNGRAALNGQYRGVAPKAKIIVVKAFTDFFPAINGNPGQTGFFDPNYLLTALDFVEMKTEEMGLPSVTLMNLGSIGGPTDGSSEICRKMDSFVDSGRLLVCGTGDDGGSDNRAGAVLAQGDTVEIQVRKGSLGNLRLDLWYENVDRLDVGLILPNGTSYGPYTAVASESGADTQTPAGLFYYHRGSDVDFFGAANDQREVLMDITGDTGVYILQVIGQQVSDGSFSVSMNPGTYFNQNKFLDHIQPGAINDYASALKVIVPTDYVHVNTWTDLDGAARGRSGEGDPGELWIGSSFGPTQDGRIGVDVAAPGEVLFTSYSPGTYYSQFRFNMLQGGNGFIGLQNAVSAASPVVTGVLALMLQADADLTPESAKMILQTTARQDAFTGSVPNTEWGYGKLDAFAAVSTAMGGQSVEDESRLILLDAFPNPAQDVLSWEVPQAGPGMIRLFHQTGQLVWESQVTEQNGMIDLSVFPEGIYQLMYTTTDRKGQKSIMIRRE